MREEKIISDKLYSQLVDAILNFTELFRFRTDQFLTVLLCLLAFSAFFSYSYITASKRGKLLFWIGSVLFAGIIGLTGGVYFWRLTHGLSGNYYVNPSWSANHVELDRYFDINGQRVDRFIDFNPNDFNDRYPFSGKPFSIKWKGYLYVPTPNYTLGVVSNFGTWLYVDDELIDGAYKIDFGTPEARTYLREGWYSDEWWGGDPALNFVWSSGGRSEFYLGLDELTDYQLIFRCMPLAYEGNPQQEVTISIAGTPVGTVVLKEGWNTYNVAIPRSYLQNIIPGFFRVRFTYSYVARPSEVLKQSNDGRQLAVAFDFAEMQQMTAWAVLNQGNLQPHSLSQGVHRITLKAQSNGIDPFITLTWKRQKEGRAEVIPEDFLFPQNLSSVRIHQRTQTERIIIGGLIVSKFFLSIFLGILVTCYIAPLFTRKLLKRDSLFLLGIGLLAFGIRLLFLLERQKTDPTFYILPHGTDQLNYVFFARGFFRGYWPNLTHGPFFHAPFISFYYIVCFLFFGETLMTIRTVTAVISIGSIVLTFLIAARTSNRVVAYIAAVFCAFNGVFILYDTSILIASLVTFLSLLALWLMFKLQERLSLRFAIMLGIILGFTALTRANIFLLMPFLLVWMLVYFPDSVQRKIRYYLLICIIMMMLVLPVTLRNYFSNDEHPIVLTNTSGGVTFWIGNNPSSNGEFGFSKKLERETKKRIKETGSFYVDEVIRYIKTHPLDYLKLEYKKLKMFWRGYEIGNLLPYYFLRQHYSKILKFPWLNFVLIGPLSIVGMFLAVKRWRVLFILYGFVCVQMLTNLIFYTLARYRFPVLPILSVFAAYTCYVISTSIWKRNFTRALLIFLAFVVLYVGINYPYAAEIYEQHYHKKMPLLNVVRYWDLFHFDVP